MSDPVDLQSEQFMTLLTDALRGGPSSPEWQQAVQALRAGPNGDGGGADYDLLIRARERLESGKEYRSVRAGAGFTRKVLQGLDDASTRSGKGLPSAGLIALIAGGVVVVIAAVVAFVLLRGGGAQTPGIEELNNTLFANTILSTTGFQGGTSLAGWTEVGELRLAAGKDGVLRPATQPSTRPASTGPAGGDAKSFQLGGIVSAMPLPAAQPVEVDADIVVGKAAGVGRVQLFVSDEPLPAGSAVGPHELVWSFEDGRATVLASDHAEAQSDKLANANRLSVRLLLNKDLAVISEASNGSASGQRLYAGPNKLSPDKPRYVGVRFVRRTGDKWETLGVAAVKVVKP